MRSPEWYPVNGPISSGADYRNFFQERNSSSVYGSVILSCLPAPPALTDLSQHTSRGSLPRFLWGTIHYSKYPEAMFPLARNTRYDMVVC